MKNTDFLKQASRKLRDNASIHINKVKRGADNVIKGTSFSLNYIADAFKNLGQNLKTLNDTQLQKYWGTRVLSNFGQELYNSGLVAEIEPIKRECITDHTSDLRCAKASFIHAGFIIMDAFDPLTYAEAACIALVIELTKDEILTPMESKIIREEIKKASDYRDILKMKKAVLNLDSTIKNLKYGRIRKNGAYDKRFNTYKNFAKALRESLELAIETVIVEFAEESEK